MKLEIVDKITWVKVTKNHKLVKGSGVTLRHSEETCLVARKGNVSRISQFRKVNNVIISEIRGLSKKPDEIYDLVEQLTPNMYYVELFARYPKVR